MERIVKELFKSFFVGILLFFVLSAIRYYNGNAYTGIKEILISFTYNQAYSVILYMSNYVFIQYLIKRYKQQLFQIENLAKGLIGAITITLTGIVFIRFITVVLIDGQSLSYFAANEELQFYGASLLISVLICGLFYGFYYYKFSQDKKVKEQKILAGTATAKYDALKNQLDPHFLFNSLNVLTSLIEENPRAATKFTTALSKVYRYVLEQKNKELVTVQEELKFAKLYMSLLKMRFEDSIVFKAPESLSNPEAKVVPLSLQLLLENAVKHNQVSEQNKLYITITEVNNTLEVKNNKQPKKVLKESSGVGLKNIYQRYKHVTDRSVTLRENDQEFCINIPILTQEIMYTQSTENFISEKKYEKAKERLEKLKGFYIHLTIYCVFVPFFLWLNFKSGTSYPWAIFPIGGWGLGVLGHAAETFNYNPFLGKDWEERKIKEIMDKDSKQFRDKF